MTAYRVYCMDGAGHISLADWIEATTDEDAIAQARRLKRHALKCEVWQHSRLVAALDVNDLGGKVLTRPGESSGQAAAAPLQ